MRRLQIKDRKALHGPAMVCAEVWNSAGMHLDREKLPEGMAPKDFLAELPEERARREAEEAAELARPVNPDQFASFKAGLTMLTPEGIAEQRKEIARQKTQLLAQKS